MLYVYHEWHHAEPAAAGMMQLSLTCEGFKRVQGHQTRGLPKKGRPVATSKASGEVWTGAKALLNALHAAKAAS